VEVGAESIVTACFVQQVRVRVSLPRLQYPVAFIFLHRHSLLFVVDTVLLPVD